MWVKYYSPDGYPYCYNEDTQESKWVDENSSELQASIDCKKQEDSTFNVHSRCIDKIPKRIAGISHNHSILSAFSNNHGPVILSDDSYLRGSDEVSSPSSAHENDVSSQGKRVICDQVEIHLLDTGIGNGWGIQFMESIGKESRMMEHEANQDISDEFQTTHTPSRIQLETETMKTDATYDSSEADFEFSDIDSDFDGDNRSELYTASSRREESSSYGDYSRGPETYGTWSEDPSISLPTHFNIDPAHQDSRSLSKLSSEDDGSKIYKTNRTINHEYYNNDISDDSQLESDFQSHNGHVFEDGEHTDPSHRNESNGNDNESTSDSASDSNGNSSLDTNTGSDSDSNRGSDSNSSDNRNIDTEISSNSDSDSDIKVTSATSDEDEQEANNCGDLLIKGKNHSLLNDNRLHRQNAIFGKKLHRLNTSAELESKSKLTSRLGPRTSSVPRVESSPRSISTTSFTFQEEISLQMFLKTDDGLKAMEVRIFLICSFLND